MKFHKLFFLSLVVASQCTSRKTTPLPQEKTNSKQLQPTVVQPNILYAQTDTSKYELATLLLQRDGMFEYNDMRDESCWLWFTTFGQWNRNKDTIVLSPNREANIRIKLQDRKFISRNDSLIFIKSWEKNPDINWGNFKIAK